MHRVAGFCIGTVEEHFDAVDVPIDEARGFERRLGRLQVGAKDEQVHVLREAHGRLIDPPHPGGNRIAADDGVGDSRVFSCAVACTSCATFSEGFHGS